MKVNFNVYFKDFDGSVLLIDKKPQCMGVIVSQCLFNGTGFRPSGNIQTDNERKLHAYSLCMRIMGSDADVDLTSEDAVLIKGSCHRSYSGLLFPNSETDRRVMED